MSQSPFSVARTGDPVTDRVTRDIADAINRILAKLDEIQKRLDALETKI